MNPERKAVVLLSGGIDSAVGAGIAKKAGYELFGLSFDYGQRHKWELESARKIAHHLEFSQHIIFPLPINQFGGSALLGDEELPKARTEAEIKEIPRTYVPARNLIFLSIGLSWAEAIRADAVVLGAHTIDYSGYPDCRPEFIDAFQKVTILGTKAGAERRLIRIWAPVIHLSKVEIIKTGMDLGLDFSITFSCYDPDEQGRACGQCDSCQIRKKAFRELNLPDPIIYR